jgi:hypothetical protein
VVALAVLHGLFGVGMLALCVAIAGFRDNDTWTRQTGFPWQLVLTTGAVFAMLALAAAVGLWRGARWAWWLVAYYQVLCVFGEGLSAGSIPLRKQSLDDAESIALLIRHSGFVIIHLLIAIYLFRPRVLAFIGLGSLRKGKALAILIGLSFLTLAAICGAVGAALAINRL